MAQCRAAGEWGAYAGGAAPGLALDAAPWIFDRELAAVACDTWGLEVLPNQTADVFQPLHIILIVSMGLLVGEIFDLEALADDCAGDGVYEFLFSAPPLPITGAVGSPVNPLADQVGAGPLRPSPGTTRLTLPAARPSLRLQDLPQAADRRQRIPPPEERPVAGQPRSG